MSWNRSQQPQGNQQNPQNQQFGFNFNQQNRQQPTGFSNEQSALSNLYQATSSYGQHQSQPNQQRPSTSMPQQGQSQSGRNMPSNTNLPPTSSNTSQPLAQLQQLLALQQQQHSAQQQQQSQQPGSGLSRGGQQPPQLGTLNQGIPVVSQAQQTPSISSEQMRLLQQSFPFQSPSMQQSSTPNPLSSQHPNQAQAQAQMGLGGMVSQVSNLSSIPGLSQEQMRLIQQIQQLQQSGQLNNLQLGPEQLRALQNLQQQLTTLQYQQVQASQVQSSIPKQNPMSLSTQDPYRLMQQQSQFQRMNQPQVLPSQRLLTSQDSGRGVNLDRGGRVSTINSSDRRRARSPPRRALSPRRSPPKRRSRSPPRHRASSPPKGGKRASPTREPPKPSPSSSRTKEKEEKEREKKYFCPTPFFPLLDVKRTYLSLKKRYSKLNISEDFVQSISYWQTSFPLESKFPLTQYHSLYCEYNDSLEKVNVESSLEDSQSPTNGKKYNARVMLCSGLPSDITSKINLNIKFLVAKIDRSDLMAIGGSWSVSKDGGDPALDEHVLIKTAVRTFREYTQLDLSHCTKWYKFLEIHYQRSKDSKTYDEITTIFVPDFSTIIPSLEKFQENWTSFQLSKKKKPETEEKKEEETESTETKEEEDESKKDIKEIPKIPGPIVLSNKPECILISLDGLLDYNETDKLEPTFEVSLFAELFQEMLQRDFGWMIFNAIKNFNGSPDKKRKRGSEDPKEIPQSKKMREEKKKEDSEMDLSSQTTSKSKDLEEEEKRETSVEPVQNQTSLQDEGSNHSLNPNEETNPNFNEEMPLLEDHVTLSSPSQIHTTADEQMKEDNEPNDPNSKETISNNSNLEPKESNSNPSSSSSNQQTKESNSSNSNPSSSSATSKEVLKKKKKIDQDLLRAFQFFDRAFCGFLKVEDVEIIFHSLGEPFSKSYVNQLCSKVAESSSKKIYYKKFVEKELED